MKQRKHHPALFHRVFLSHLLVVLLCFVAALIMVQYLFADGIGFFLLRNPIILLPALLAIIGIVGLLALWTAGSVASPVDRLTSLLNDGAGTDELDTLRSSVGTEEMDILLSSLQQRLQSTDRLRSSHTYQLLVDPHLNILWTEGDTAARLGYTSQEMQRKNLRTLLTDASDAVQLHGAMRVSGSNDTAVLSLTLHSAGDRMLRIRFAVQEPLPGKYFLNGNEALS